MIYIGSLIFTLLFWIITAPLSLIFLCLWLIPFVKNKRYIFDKLASLWAKTIVWLLKVLCGIKYEIRGWSQIDKSKPYIIIGKHQSTFETLILHTFISNPSPIFILKKQLVLVPFMGWVLASINHISIDREGRMETIRKMMKDTKKYVSRGHNIVIFPQGTRTPPESNTIQYPYKTGFLSIIRECKCDIIPMALNSGLFWKKKQFKKNKGIIVLDFLKPIKYNDIKDLPKEDIVKKLEDIIETRTAELLNVK
jgi:1-acyl-sn-glycerol-3-phosphate acyltransferase